MLKIKAAGANARRFAQAFRGASIDPPPGGTIGAPAHFPGLGEALIQDEVFERPGDFNLADFWTAWCADFEVSRPYYPVTARVAPELIPHLPGLFGESFRQVIAEAAAPDEKGWLTLVLPFETFEAARGRVLALGRAIEVIEPEALRCSVVDFARQTMSRYAGNLLQS